MIDRIKIGILSGWKVSLIRNKNSLKVVGYFTKEHIKVSFKPEASSKVFRHSGINHRVYCRVRIANIC